MSKPEDPKDFEIAQGAAKAAMGGPSISLAPEETPDPIRSTSNNLYYTPEEVAAEALRLNTIRAEQEKSFAEFLRSLLYFRIEKPAANETSPGVATAANFFNNHKEVKGVDSKGSAHVAMKNGQTISIHENDVKHVSAVGEDGKPRAFTYQDAVNMALAARSNPNLAPPKEIRITNASRAEKALLKAAIQQVNDQYGASLNVKKGWGERLASFAQAAVGKAADKNQNGPHEAAAKTEAVSGSPTGAENAASAVSADNNEAEAGSGDPALDSATIIDLDKYADFDENADWLKPEWMRVPDDKTTIAPEQPKSRIAYIGTTGDVTSEAVPRAIHEAEIVDGNGKGTRYFYAFREDNKQDIILTVLPDGTEIRDPNIYIVGDTKHDLVLKNEFLAMEDELGKRETEIRQSPVVGKTVGANPAKVYELTENGHKILTAYKGGQFRLLEIDGRQAAMNKDIEVAKTPEYLATLAERAAKPEPLILKDPIVAGRDMTKDFVFTTTRDKTKPVDGLARAFNHTPRIHLAEAEPDQKPEQRPASASKGPQAAGPA